MRSLCPRLPPLQPDPRGSDETSKGHGDSKRKAELITDERCLEVESEEIKRASEREEEKIVWTF